MFQVVNDRLKKSHIADRMRRLESGRGIDWATAEALAMGTLLHQGVCLIISIVFEVISRCLV